MTSAPTMQGQMSDSCMKPTKFYVQNIKWTLKIGVEKCGLTVVDKQVRQC